MLQDSLVNASLALSPSGLVYLNKFYSQEKVAAEFIQKIEPLFSQSSAHGLLSLGLASQQEKLPESFKYWQQFVHRFMAEICHNSELVTFATLKEPSVPHADELENLCQIAPFFAGYEQISPELLMRIWKDLYTVLIDELKKSAGTLKDFLAIHNTPWNLVGRICFHFAENKNYTEKPFAFLATYTVGLSEGDIVKHLPLRAALQEYAGKKNNAALLALLLPIQRAAQTSECIKKLIDSHEIFQPQAWNSTQAYAFLRDIEHIEAAGILVRVPNWWSSQKPPRPQVQLVVGEKPNSHVGFGGMLDFNLEITLSTGEKLSPEEVEEILHAQAPLIKVKGQWIEADSEKIGGILIHWKQIQAQAKRSGISFVQGLRLLAGMPLSGTDAAHLPTDAAQWTMVTAGPWLNEILTQLRHPDRNVVHHEQGVLARYVHAQLRPYQIQGVQWLLFLYKLKLGGCLADDMGLGKTIQVLSFLMLVKHGESTQKPHLLVVPASLIGNWAHEIERFVPTLRVLFVHPSMNIDIKKLTSSDFANVDIVITTYAFVHRIELLRATMWETIILDEAQLIKNASSKQARAVKELQASVRFVMTGTPIENTLADLWSLFDFFAHGLLGSAKAFTEYSKEFARSSNGDRGDDKKLQFYRSVRNLTAPYILRRLKTDKRIIADLPDKTEMITYCGLSSTQITLYQQAVDELKRQLDTTVDGIKRRGLIFHYLMRFKQICNHPSQWLGYGNYQADESGKFERLKELCEQIAAKQEKVLIFTQFQEIIPALAAYLRTIFKRDGLVLHGNIPVKKRIELTQEFAFEQGPPFFILSLRAGGTGLNLTQAMHVIHFDRWWNPAVENQATDRAYRIGQKRNVIVYKFVSSGTLEEKIDALINQKKAVAAEVLQSGNEIELSELTNDQILNLVKLDIHKVCNE